MRYAHLALVGQSLRNIVERYLKIAFEFNWKMKLEPAPCDVNHSRFGFLLCQEQHQLGNEDYHFLVHLFPKRYGDVAEEQSRVVSKVIT